MLPTTDLNNMDRQRFPPMSGFDPSTSFVPNLSISPPNSYQPISVSPPPIMNNPVMYVPSPEANLVVNTSERFLGPPPQMQMGSPLALDGNVPQMYSTMMGGLSPTGPPTHAGFPSITSPTAGIPPTQPQMPSTHHVTPSRPHMSRDFSSSSGPPPSRPLPNPEQTRMFRALRALEVVQRCAFMLDEESKAYRSQFDTYSQLGRSPMSNQAEMEKCYADMKQTLINLQYYYSEMKTNLTIRNELGLNTAEESIFTKFDNYFTQFEASQMNLVQQGAQYLAENNQATPIYYPPHSRTQYGKNLRREMTQQMASGSGGSSHSGGGNARSGASPGGTPSGPTPNPATASAVVIASPTGGSAVGGTPGAGGPPQMETQLSEQIQRILSVLVAAQAHVEQQGARIKKQIEQALRCDPYKRFNDVSLFLFGACRQELLLRGGQIDFALHLPYPWKRKEAVGTGKHKDGSDSKQTPVSGRSLSSRSRTGSIDSTSDLPPVPMTMNKHQYSAGDQKTMKNSPRIRMDPESASRSTARSVPEEEASTPVVPVATAASESTKDVLDGIFESVDMSLFGTSVRKVDSTSTRSLEPKKKIQQAVAAPRKSPPMVADGSFDPKDQDDSTETTASLEPNLQYEENTGASDDLITAIERCLRSFQIDSEFHRIFSNREDECVTFDDARSMFHVSVRPYKLAHMRSTRLVTTFVQIDTRVRRLIIVCKYWAQQRRLSARLHGFSTFALCCMVIHYLQCTKPKVLPVLPIGEKRSMNWESADCVAMSGQFRRSIGSNKQSDGDLLIGFFKYYGTDFHYEQHMISIRLGSAMHKSLIGGAANDAFVIEDPFDIRRNIMANFDENDLDVLKTEMNEACHTLMDSQNLTEICRVYTFK